MTTQPGMIFFGSAVFGLAVLLGGCDKPHEAAASAAASAPAAPSAVGNVADADVTTNVKTALGQDAALNGFDIRVETLKGDVRLTGVVDSQAQIDDALKLARAADGVHSIHDELTVKK